MRVAPSSWRAFAVVLVAVAALAAPVIAEADVPTGFTAVATSDHEVDLHWTWPVGSTPPDDLQVWRNGVAVDSVPVSSTSYADVAPSPATTYSYKLVALVGSVPSSTPNMPATTRHDLPNAPTDVVVTSAQGTGDTTDATIAFTRGEQDADVTYNVTAVQDSTGGTTTVTRQFAADDPSRRSVDMQGLPSYTAYHFTVSAVETAGDPPSDPGGTASAAPDGATTLDVAAPTFSPPQLTANRASVGSIALSWPSAQDAGTGVVRYEVCADAPPCTPATYDPLSATGSATVSGIPDDDAKHTISVTAVDGQGNESLPISAEVLMPKLQPPIVALDNGASNGCSALVARGKSPDGLDSKTQLFVDGKKWPSGTEVAGEGFAPFQSVQLSALTTFGAETAATPGTTSARVYDPTPPTDAPTLHGVTDMAGRTYTLSWDPITADGSPVTGYGLTNSNVPGSTGAGSLVGQSTAPRAVFTGLQPDMNYTVSVAALDSCGHAGPTRTTTFALDDVTPPGMPNVSTSSTTNSVTLSWAPVKDDVQVEGYQVRRDSEAPVTIGDATSYTDTGRETAHSYTYEVRAVDTANNFGQWSAAKVVSTKDGEAPTVTGTPVPKLVKGDVRLHWTAATDNSGAVAKYVISRSTNGSTFSVVGWSTSTAFVDTTVPPGTHLWSVYAVDAAGNASKSRSTIVPLATTAPLRALQATKVLLSSPPGARLLRYGGKPGTRMLLSFTLKADATAAKLNLRVLRGTAKVKVSLPLGASGTAPGKRLAERRAKKGVLVIPLGTMPKGTLRLIVTASQGSAVTLTAPKGAKKPTISQR